MLVGHAQVLNGTTLLSPHLLETGRELIRGETPMAWQRLWEGIARCSTY